MQACEGVVDGKHCLVFLDIINPMDHISVLGTEVERNTCPLIIYIFFTPYSDSLSLIHRRFYTNILNMIRQRTHCFFFKKRMCS